MSNTFIKPADIGILSVSDLNETKSKGKWIVVVKGQCGEHFEISVVRSGNKHGIKSYGWFDKDKILISSSGGPCGDTVPHIVWEKLIRIATEIAMELNEDE